MFLIGAVASGKSTLGRSLARQLNLPLREGDAIAHDDNATPRRKRTPEEQAELIRALDAQGGWIVEGVYRPSYHCLLELSDAVVLLDTPLPVRTLRVFTRFLRQRMGRESCLYEPNLKMLRNMLRWTAAYERERAQRQALLEPWRHKLIVVRSTGARAEREVLSRLSGIQPIRP